ncbi:MAG: hypothetical protein AAF903_05030 [Pseudomonadota bacterium]
MASPRKKSRRGSRVVRPLVPEADIKEVPEADIKEVPEADMEDVPDALGVKAGEEEELADVAFIGAEGSPKGQE